LDKPLHVIYKVSKLAYRIPVILIANERVKKNISHKVKVIFLRDTATEFVRTDGRTTHANMEQWIDVSTTAPGRQRQETQSAPELNTRSTSYILSSFFMNLNSIFVYVLNVRSGPFPNTSSSCPHHPPFNPRAFTPSTRHMYSCLPCLSLYGKGLLRSLH
jgi:hypothetical protein